MKKFLLPVTILVLMSACSESFDTPISEPEIMKSRILGQDYLEFYSPEQLEAIILQGSISRSGIEIPEDFISLVSPINPDDDFGRDSMMIAPVDTSGMMGTPMNLTYYEKFGYDSLVPNINFARLLNIKGEMCVDGTIISIKPQGTYSYPVTERGKYDLFIKSGYTAGEVQSDGRILIMDNLYLTPTFDTDPNYYEFTYEGDFDELPDDYFGDDDDDGNTHNTVQGSRSTIPDDIFDSFPVYSNKSHTILGKFIESIIGSTKTITVNFNNKRRVRGSFYSYNYLVYHETGVKGWTDKKNWIGWSKTESDELQVGWRDIIIDLVEPGDYRSKLQKLSGTAYIPVRSVRMCGNVYWACTLMVPGDEGPWREAMNKGFKEVMSRVKKVMSLTSSDVNKATAIYLALPSGLYLMVSGQDIVKYNVKYYCHVFEFGYFRPDGTVGWSSEDGFYINGHSGNLGAIRGVAEIIKQALEWRVPGLAGGHVYVAARFNDQWRGMKIQKEFN